MVEKKPSVLIVDDQPNWREVLSSLLEDDYAVTSVDSYVEAQKSLLGHDFDLVVTDIRLDDADPDNEDGLELIRRLNAMADYARTIVVTGYPTYRTVKEAVGKKLDALDYILKYPEDGSHFDRDYFRQTVRRAVELADTSRREKRDRGRVLVFESDLDLRCQLAKSLRESPYPTEIKELGIPDQFIEALQRPCGLIIIGAGSLSITEGEYSLWERIRKLQPNAKTIIVTDTRVDEIVRAVQQGAYAVPVGRGQPNPQEFLEAVHQVFAPEGTKYIWAEVDEMREQDRLEVGKTFTLILSLQDKPGRKGEYTPLWIPPGGEQSTIYLQVRIYAPGMKIETERKFYWLIPAEGKPTPCRIELTPDMVGKQTIFIDIYRGQTWNPIEKEVKVTAAKGT